MHRLHKEPMNVLTSFFKVSARWFYTSGWKASFVSCVSYLFFPQETYWVFTGIASSIGFGSGFQTGPLILFPYVSSIASNTGTIEESYYKVIYPTFLWGLGTAIGEIPPFYASKILTHNVNKTIQEKMKTFIKTLGAPGIFLLACYPNATFDVAGVMAGMSGMPFYKFFMATLLGKACVKAQLQVLFIIYTTQNITENTLCTFDLYGLKKVWEWVVICIMSITCWFFIESVAQFDTKTSKIN